jgi:hypothetical protein
VSEYYAVDCLRVPKGLRCEGVRGEDHRFGIRSGFTLAELSTARAETSAAVLGLLPLSRRQCQGSE